MGKVEIDMAVYPHVKRFILKELQAVEPVEIRLDSIEGKLMLGMLHERGRSYRQIPDRMSARLKVVLPDEVARRTIRIRHVVNWNLYYDRLFKRMMFVWIERARGLHQSEFEAIEDFLEHYGIEEAEYGKLTAHRAWMRWKNGRIAMARAGRGKITARF